MYQCVTNIQINIHMNRGTDQVCTIFFLDLFRDQGGVCRGPKWIISRGLDTTMHKHTIEITRQLIITYSNRS